MCNPVYTKIGHNAVFLIITYDIIEVIIPYKGRAASKPEHKQVRISSDMMFLQP